MPGNNIITRGFGRSQSRVITQGYGGIRYFFPVDDIIETPVLKKFGHSNKGEEFLRKTDEIIIRVKLVEINNQFIYNSDIKGNIHLEIDKIQPNISIKIKLIKISKITLEKIKIFVKRIFLNE